VREFYGSQQHCLPGKGVVKIPNYKSFEIFEQAKNIHRFTE